MSGSQDSPNYSREKRLTVTFDSVTRDYILIAPSAKDLEEARKDAQRTQTDIVRRLPELAEAVRTVFLLQEAAILTEALLAAENGDIIREAALTLDDGEPDYQEKAAAKAEALKESRRAELAALSKAQLADKLVAAETNRQLAAAWHCAVMNAAITRALHAGDGRRLFASADEMRAALPEEVLQRLYEALGDFLHERGDAKVFPEPHTSKGWTTTPGGMG